MIIAELSFKESVSRKISTAVSTIVKARFGELFVNDFHMI